MMTRKALQLWDEMLMGEERQAAIAEVDGKIKSGQLTWSDVRSSIHHPENPGLIQEGAELEGAQDGNHSWLDGNHLLLISGFVLLKLWTSPPTLPGTSVHCPRAKHVACILYSFFDCGVRSF